MPAHNKPSLSELTGLPTYSTDLLDVLERSFPLKNPHPDATLAEVQREAGRQDLIQLLRDLKSRGEDSVPA